MGLRSLFSGNNSSSSNTSSAETRRPILDPDSGACVWATPTEAADEDTVTRMLAQARDQLS